MVSIMDNVARATANQGLASFCLSQLPRTVRDKFECITETDAYLLAPRAMFKRKGTNEVFECVLVETESAQPELADMKIKVPEEFIAKLCVIV